MVLLAGDGVEDTAATLVLVLAPPVPEPLLRSAAGWPKLVVLSVARWRGEKTCARAAALDSNAALQASHRPRRVSRPAGCPTPGGCEGSTTVS